MALWATDRPQYYFLVGLLVFYLLLTPQLDCFWTVNVVVKAQVFFFFPMHSVHEDRKTCVQQRSQPPWNLPDPHLDPAVSTRASALSGLYLIGWDSSGSPWHLLQSITASESGGVAEPHCVCVCLLAMGELGRREGPGASAGNLRSGGTGLCTEQVSITCYLKKNLDITLIFPVSCNWLPLCVYLFVFFLFLFIYFCLLFL